MNPIQAFLLADIFDQFPVPIIKPNCDKSFQYLKTTKTNQCPPNILAITHNWKSFLVDKILRFQKKNWCLITDEEGTMYC